MSYLFDVLPAYILCGSIALTYSSPVCYNEELCWLPPAALPSASPGMHTLCSGGQTVIIGEHSLSLKPFQIYGIFFFSLWFS